MNSVRLNSKFKNKTENLNTEIHTLIQENHVYMYVQIYGKAVIFCTYFIKEDSKNDHKTFREKFWQ